MASPIAAQLLLCDAAQADATTGKVNMLGAGWSLTGTPTAPSAVAALIKVPWDRANQKIDIHLRLLHADGQPVAIAAPLGSQELSVRTSLEVGRPAGLEHGSDIDAGFVLNVPSLPLPVGRYQWRLDLGDDTVTASFQVR